MKNRSFSISVGIAALLVLISGALCPFVCAQYTSAGKPVESDNIVAPREESESQQPRPQRMQGIFDEAMNIDKETGQTGNRVLIDDFDEPSKFNKLGLITNVYMMPPSRAMITFAKVERNGQDSIALKIRYKRATEGGPYDKGGWCGYYTTLKEQSNAGTRYFNAKKYDYITFWVRGEEGGENFVLGVADRHWDIAGDSLKSREVINFVPEKRITKKWQKAKVPLKEFLLDIGKLSSIAVCFEPECFPEGNAEGYVYIDDIALE